MRCLSPVNWSASNTLWSVANSVTPLQGCSSNGSHNHPIEHARENMFDVITMRDGLLPTNFIRNHLLRFSLPSERCWGPGVLKNWLQSQCLVANHFNFKAIFLIWGGKKVPPTFQTNVRWLQKPCSSSQGTRKGVPLTYVYPWHLLCSLGILGIITHKHPLYRAYIGISHRGTLVGLHPTIPWSSLPPKSSRVVTSYLFSKKNIAQEQSPGKP